MGCRILFVVQYIKTESGSPIGEPLSVVGTTDAADCLFPSGEWE